MLSYLSTLFSEPLSFFDQAIYRVLAVLIALCCHEWGHAYIAHRCGDDTAKNAGRMTINPLAHLDPIGTVLMFFVGFGYARPVPVNPYNFRGDRVKADLKVSLAGITVNLILFLLFSYISSFASLAMWERDMIDYYGINVLISYRYNVIWNIISGQGEALYGTYIARKWLIPVVRLSAYTALINLNLAVFNLLPIPPLDGYHVFNDILFKGKIQLSAMGFRIAMVIVLILASQGIFSQIIYRVIDPVQALILVPIKMIWG